MQIPTGVTNYPAAALDSSSTLRGVPVLPVNISTSGYLRDVGGIINFGFWQ